LTGNNVAIIENESAINIAIWKSEADEDLNDWDLENEKKDE
jgi:hypothetical protein